MNYLTNYYKNLCESLEHKLNILKIQLNEINSYEQGIRDEAGYTRLGDLLISNNLPQSHKSGRFMRGHRGEIMGEVDAYSLPPGVPGTANYGPPTPYQTDPLTRDPVPNTDAYNQKTMNAPARYRPVSVPSIQYKPREIEPSPLKPTEIKTYGSNINADQDVSFSLFKALAKKTGKPRNWWDADPNIGDPPGWDKPDRTIGDPPGWLNANKDWIE